MNPIKRRRLKKQTQAIPLRGKCGPQGPMGPPGPPGPSMIIKEETVMLKLTSVPHPDINGGKPSPIYVDPRRIICIATVRALRTEIHLDGGTDTVSVHVSESPEEVVEAMKFDPFGRSGG